uniref:Rho-GAP domain-containing protein n=2 Tax=Strongyloides stercoralis TaxID=6248 RepID=A0A0K0ET26_STRER
MDFKESCNLINSCNLIFEELEKLEIKDDNVDYELVKILEDLSNRCQKMEQINYTLQMELEEKEKNMLTIEKKLLIKDKELSDSQKEVQFLQTQQIKLERKSKELSEIVNTMKNIERRSPKILLPSLGHKPKLSPYKCKYRKKMSLSDVCPKYFPMIPGIVIHCVEGIEEFHLTTEELYHLPISYKEVSKLYNDFLNSNSIPILQFASPSTIVGCLQKFLRAICDPIIPQNLWIKFESAIQKVNKDDLISSIHHLPKPNLQTLAYLCLHWIKISEECYSNKKLAICDLSDILGSTVVGFKTPPGIISAEEMEKEIETQKLIMLALLQLPKTFWETFLSIENRDAVY